MKYLKIAFIAALVVAGVLVVYTGWRKSHSNRVGQSASAGYIRIGTNRALGTVIPYVARDKGFFQQDNVQVQIVDFNDVTTLMEAFASGQIDVALVGIAPAAIWQEKGVSLKVVAAANGGGHVLLTRADTGINDLEGLKNKKVATPKPGTVTDTLFRAYLVQDLAKLDPDKDIKIVAGLSAADLPTVLFVSREVDAAITWEPFASQAEAKFKDAKILFDASEQWRRNNPQSKQLYPVNVVIARQPFIDSHADELRSLLKAHVRTVQFINEHPDEANEIIARETGLDKGIVAHARKRIDYTEHVDVDASLKTLQWSKQLLYLKEVPSTAKLFDLKYLPVKQGDQ